jgi:hypothetical protein
MGDAATILITIVSLGITAATCFSFAGRDYLGSGPINFLA